MFRSVVLFLVVGVLLVGSLLVRFACRPRRTAPGPAAEEAASRRERSLGPHRENRRGRPALSTASEAAPEGDDLPQAQAGDGPRGPHAATRAGRPRRAAGAAPPAGPATASTPGTAGTPDPEDELPPTVWPVTRDGIRGALRERLDEIKECYQGWLAVEPDLAGAVTVGFRIEPTDSGQARVADVDISVSDLQHPWLEGCILAMIGSLSFENPDGGPVTVRYPFRFAAGPPDSDAPTR